MSEDTQEYVKQVYRVLINDPTNPSNLNFLVEAHARIGRLAAMAQGEAEAAETERKYHEATSVREVKDANPKFTTAQVDAQVFIDNYTYRKAENKAVENAAKLKNLLDSVREGINGIKFLGREAGTGVRIGP